MPSKTHFAAPNGSDSNTGTRRSPWSLSRANASAAPGDVILLGGGSYGTPIRPVRSGAEGGGIVYRAIDGEEPLFTDIDLAIDLRRRSHITVEGVTAKDVGRFLWAEGSDHLAIDRCRFEKAPGWESCKLKRMGECFRFTDNVLKNGSDLFAIQGGERHLIEGNVFDTAWHTCLVLMGVQRSVVRGNRLANPVQKLMEVFTTRHEDWEDPPRKSTYVLIENNHFGPATHESPGMSGSWGIQYAGNRCIVRGNVFVDCGGGLDVTGYGTKRKWNPEALHDRSNRFYNNVIHDCGEQGRYGSGPGISISHGIEDFGDQLFINNIVCGNRAYPDSHYPEDVPRAIQVAFSGRGDPSQARFFYNDIIGEKAGDKVFWRNKVKRGYTVREYEAEYPDWAAGNIEADPQFVDPKKGDFSLRPGSPCIDAGGPLTRTTAGGEGAVVGVEDATFFCDGFGVVEPDVIHVGAERVKIVSVDHEKHRIEIDAEISWRTGAPVSLDHAGKAPDIGAFEFGYEKGGRAVEPGTTLRSGDERGQ